jgi:polyphosphate kinase
LLTGYSQGHEWKKLLVAPRGLRERMVELIRRERRNAEAGRRARMIVKMNALVEPSLIDELYDASQAGVEIDLLVRGICCLRPGLRGISERIRVRGVVDRFLEHSRIFYFENDGDPEIFLGSADWMPRNFYRRIEIAFPVESPRLKERIIGEILPVVLADNVRARSLGHDGVYQRLAPAHGDPSVRSQMVFQELARRSEGEAKELVRQISPGLTPPEDSDDKGQSAA